MGLEAAPRKPLLEKDHGSWGLGVAPALEDASQSPHLWATPGSHLVSASSSHSMQPGVFTEGSAGGPGWAQACLTDAVPPSAALAGVLTLQQLFRTLPCWE